MNINLDELNKLNQENAANPGKIAAVYDWLSRSEYFIYEVDQFDPLIQDLLITQIWTNEQEQLVRSKIKHLVQTLSGLNFYQSNTDVLELIRLYEMLLVWVSSVEYSITVSD